MGACVHVFNATRLCSSPILIPWCTGGWQHLCCPSSRMYMMNTAHVCHDGNSASTEYLVCCRWGRVGTPTISNITQTPQPLVPPVQVNSAGCSAQPPVLNQSTLTSTSKSIKFDTGLQIHTTHVSQWQYVRDVHMLCCRQVRPS